MRHYEHEYEGPVELICGIDEAGRGPLAGPVVAGAVILPKDCEILGLNDSKKLSEKKREELYDEIMEKAVAAAVGIVGPARIDEINILQATYEAMREAVEPNFQNTPDSSQRRRTDPGHCDSTGSDHQGRCQECFHRGSQYSGESDQGPAHVRV